MNLFYLFYFLILSHVDGQAIDFAMFIQTFYWTFLLIINPVAF